MKTVLITGVTGQDGSHMVDYILENTNYDILGGVRRLSVKNHANLSHIANKRFSLIDLDITDSHSVESAITKFQPDYFINFYANSFVGTSFFIPLIVFYYYWICVFY
jgi:GDP-4-dehydro-6-deoxy-D-mannose reductase